MKQLFTIYLFFSFGNLLFSQEATLFSTRQVKEMAVFPGCEKIDPTDKDKMNACLSEQLSQRLSTELIDFDEVMKQSRLYKATAKIQFVISKEGIIIDINELKGSNPILAVAAVQALVKISEELPPIRPAKLETGMPVNIVYQLPVKYQIELEDEEVAQIYPVDEIVLFTLIDNELRYEIRLFKNKDIKAYEIKNDTETYLGKFLSLAEIERSEPYKSLINKERLAQKTLVTDGYIEEEFFEVYIHNLFGQEKEKPIFVEVVKVYKDHKVTVSKFEKEAEFNKSRFASLIYRD